MNKKLLYLFVILSCFVIYISQSSFSSGYSSGATNGCNCHGAANTATLVSISGFPTNYVNNQVYPVSISVTNSSMIEAGFTLSVSNGTLTTPSAGSAISGTEIRHNTPKLLVGGTATWTFNWTAPASGSAVNTVKAAGNAVNNDNGTSGDQWSFAPSITVNGPALPLSLTVSNSNIACNNGVSTITSTASGGTAPYQYRINGGAYQSSNSFTNNLAGTYTITTRDATTIATASTIVVINQPNPISLNINSSNNPTCFGFNNGSTAVFAATGGTGLKTYNWTPGNPSGDGTISITGLSSNTWTCTATDANGCNKSTTVLITNPAAITATTTTNSVTCFGGNNGSAAVTPTGGTSPYTYSWSPSGGTGATATGLSAGNYFCSVTDANLCSAFASVVVIQPLTAITATTTTNSVSCFGGNNGSAAVTPTGGTSPYTYSWSPSGGTGATATGLSAGNYFCSVTDANLCSAFASVVVMQPLTAITVPSSSNSVTCFGGSNGFAAVTPTGGTDPYTYSWSPSGGTGATATGLNAGNYFCSVTDANLCSAFASVVVMQPAAIIAIANANNANLCSGNLLQLYGSNSANDLNYSYTWSNGIIDNVPSTASTSTNYTVTGTNSLGCIITSSININVNPVSSLALSSVNNGNSMPGSICETMSQINGSANNYTNSNCNLIASVQNSAGNSLGDITSCVEVLSTVPQYNNQPYLPRIYTITPQNQGPAQLTLYYTTDDILNYNNFITNNNSSFPLLVLPNSMPQDGDIIPNTSITKVSGGTIGIPFTTVETSFVDLIYDASNNRWSATLSVMSFSSFYLHATNSVNAPLNVLITNFSGEVIPLAHLLNWQIIKENDVLDYEILHSINGVDFSTIEKIKANGNSSYNFTNRNFIYGKNYYKLKINSNKTNEPIYSNIITLESINKSNTVEIYPNPVKGLLQFKHPDIGNLIQYQIIDGTGKLVLQSNFIDKKEPSIDVSQLSAGVYIILFTNNNGKSSKQKFVIK
jgi:hypothetical protein